MASNHVPTSSDSWSNDADSWAELRDERKALQASELRPFEVHDDEMPLDAELLTKKTYVQGDTIDWLHEEALERARQHDAQMLRGAPRLALTIKESSQIFVIVVVAGVGVGMIGAWLDVLVHWLNDLRTGRCVSGITFNEIACCTGLEPGEPCTEWMTWSQWFGVRSIAGGSLIQTIAYILLAITYAAAAAVLVRSYAPYAFHTGIPEIKAILNGYVLDAFLGPWTLLIKGLGLALSVASGLSLGKEGPMVHVSCCLAALAASFFPSFGKNEIRKRLIMSAASCAGVSVAFGSPLGGVLFGLEELDLFSNERLIWTAFVTSCIASVSLQYADPFGTGKLVLFQITPGATELPWRAFELVPWLLLGTIGGVLGSLFTQANVKIAVFRERSYLRQWPVTEVIIVTAITAFISFLVPFMKVQSSDLVANLFKECDSNFDYHGLCNSGAVWSTAFLLAATAGLKLALTAFTFGIKVPAGIFLPSLAVGASLGRGLGIVLQGLHRNHPKAWLFASCPAEGDCISPAFYAVIGAAAMLGGVTRMTISIVVILFELTGALSHVLPIMIAVMSSKWVADSLSKEGIYTAWIALHGYPFLPNAEYRDSGESAAEHMVAVEKLRLVDGRAMSLRQLSSLSESAESDGFPVVVDGMLLGYATRDALRTTIAPLLTNTSAEGDRVDLDGTMCTFVPESENAAVDVSSCITSASIRLHQGTPLEIVVRLFQTLNIQYVLFTSLGQLTGLMRRRDVTKLINDGLDYTGALADRELERLRGTM